MATMIFVDQENGELGAAKSQLKLPLGSSKVLVERTQVNTPLPKKAISTSPVTYRSVRKALGNVNKTEGVTSKMDKIKQKNQPCTVNKVKETVVLFLDWLPFRLVLKNLQLPRLLHTYSLSQTDFESFDLPEEHKLSNINLCGVPLMIFERTYDSCVNMVPSPVKTEGISWESNLLQSTADFLATLDEIIDMPPPNYDV
ncbi:PTTG1 protein, partial [Falcunculus frontatus]|nr:PTTG1 protein [Falcunculus frontatus]